MSNANTYTYRITWSPDDGEHVGLCAEFPSLSWLDPDPGCALNGIMSLVMEVVAEMEQNGEVVPEAFSEKRYSGNIPARVTPMVHRKLAIEAAEKGISMNRLVAAKLAL
ncbi:type II toxin-antitoxin system HicB family antitoxin [Corticimicrobacter populi]|uniref:Toxin-antitoxin system HicB family antitoxin n=1 Tax=Corticimicrobacter populi TaxID=2175229 RepID=A0A2V1K319_9BURK|nr:toxin-antitoxin system HicB family antitoxin [Corticimicrobacter populi]PWF25481.1 toxin-antitoxin system HicB family antitoxin [Corticimicrobacter populi]